MAKNTVTIEQIKEIMKNSEYVVTHHWNKCTVVLMQMPNGFTLVEKSACVDPANYDAKMGEEICMRKLEDKIWELEGYKLQCKLFEGDK